MKAFLAILKKRLFFTSNLILARRAKFTHFLISLLIFGAYLIGISILSYVKATPWQSTPAFWIGIVRFPLVIKFISGLTIIAGTVLIYFVPGVFIYKYFASKHANMTEVFFKGFLINYLFYFFASFIYKLFFPFEITRQTMLIFICALIILLQVAASFYKDNSKIDLSSFHMDFRFLLFYVIFLFSIFYFCRKPILFNLFSGDGVEQYWSAFSAKIYLLPTAFRESFTLIPQFSFSPSVYLNMFALLLFGSSEFVLRIEVLFAFIALGLILKNLIMELSCIKNFSLSEYLIFFLYLAVYFILIAYRADNETPSDLSSIHEPLQLMLLISGFYLLVGRKKQDILAAIFFVLAGMIRYSGLLMISIFIIIFSILFKRYKCILFYFLGLSIVFTLLIIIVIAVNFSSDIHYVFRNVWEEYGRRNTTFAPGLRYTLEYLKNYFIFTSGLSLFFIGFKNKYILLMFLTTVLYLIVPLKSICIPADYYVPLFMFPLLCYYLWKKNT